MVPLVSFLLVGSVIVVTTAVAVFSIFTVFRQVLPGRGGINGLKGSVCWAQVCFGGANEEESDSEADHDKADNDNDKGDYNSCVEHCQDECLIHNKQMQDEEM